MEFGFDQPSVYLLQSPKFLTEESFDRFEDVVTWWRRVGKRKPNVVDGREISVSVESARISRVIGRSQQTVLEQPDRVRPRLVWTVHQVPVEKRRHLVQLRTGKKLYVFVYLFIY